MARHRLTESTIDPNYTHFAVNKKTNLIVNGWDYSDYEPYDLRNDRRYYFMDDLIDMGFNPADYTILTRNVLIRRGIDPNNEMENWSNDGLVSLIDQNRQNKTQYKTENIMRGGQTIKLTESRLRGMICEAVKSALNEIKVEGDRAWAEDRMSDMGFGFEGD